jgi:ASC-1-like (ASCH) protein
MMYTMHLDENPYNRMQSGNKTIELRLNDEKRKALEVGDIIKFYNRSNKDEFLDTMVLSLYNYGDFKSFFEVYGLKPLGHPKEYTLDKVLANLQEIYPKEKEKKFGVLAIKIELINSII